MLIRIIYFIENNHIFPNRKNFCEKSGTVLHFFQSSLISGLIEDN